MRAVAAFGATAILILVPEVWVCVAGAEDTIRPGKWEWTVVVPKMQKPPPGTQLSHSMRWGPEGVITSVCLRETKLKPPHVHRRLPTIVNGDLGKGSCDMDVTTDAATATRSMSINCAWSSGATSRVEGVMHFHDNTLDGTATNRLSFPDKPAIEQSSVLKGRYVGPCDPK
jgi:hypothetical protein